MEEERPRPSTSDKSEFFTFLAVVAKVSYSDLSSVNSISEGEIRGGDYTIGALYWQIILYPHYPVIDDKNQRRHKLPKKQYKEKGDEERILLKKFP